MVSITNKYVGGWGKQESLETHGGENNILQSSKLSGQK